MSLWILRHVNCVDEGVVVHVRGRKGFYGNVCYPTTDLVMTRRDKASIFEVKGMED